MTGTAAFAAFANDPPWPQWTDAHWDQASAEGWDMFWLDTDKGSGLEIQFISDMNVFNTDYAAIRHVELCAIGGSELHQLAMKLERSWYHGQDYAYWEQPAWCDHYGRYLDTVR